MRKVVCVRIAISNEIGVLVLLLYLGESMLSKDV
jgi:hypothetical protein